VSDERVSVRFHFHLSPADVALPDGRVFEGVLVSITGDEVSVWQAVDSAADGDDQFALVWSGTRSADGEESAVPEPGTFTILTGSGPMEVAWPWLLTASPGGENR
jgi:hypothetical protein